VSADSAFPVREHITKAAALSYLVVRSCDVLVQGRTVFDTSVRLAIAILIETPMVVLCCALVINVLFLHVILQKIRVIAQTTENPENGPNRPIHERSEPFRADPL
jgi:hypothetical protein